MDIIVENIQIDRNIVEHELIGSSSKYMSEGRKTVNVQAKVINMTQEQLDNLTNNTEPLDLYADVGDESYLLKNCRMTGYDISMGVGSPVECTVDFVADDAVSPAYVKVKFKDVELDVDYRHYSQLENEDLESMTYNEFKDRVMVEEL